MFVRIQDSTRPKSERDFNTRPSKWDLLLNGAFDNARIGSRVCINGALLVRLKGETEPHKVPVHITCKSIYENVVEDLGLHA